MCAAEENLALCRVVRMYLDQSHGTGWVFLGDV